jgi:hypothetical protein
VAAARALVVVGSSEGGVVEEQSVVPGRPARGGRFHRALAGAAAGARGGGRGAESRRLHVSLGALGTAHLHTAT